MIRPRWRTADKDGGVPHRGVLAPHRTHWAVTSSQRLRFPYVRDREWNRTARLHINTGRCRDRSNPTHRRTSCKDGPRGHRDATRIESSVTSLSWIPSEAVTGLNKVMFGSGFTHYDDPPPDVIHDLEALAGRRPVPVRQPPCRHGSTSTTERIVDAGYDGGCVMGATTVAVGGKQASFAAVAFDDIQRDDRADRDIGDVHPDGRWAHRGARAAPREQAAVRQVRGTDRVVDVVADDPRRRNERSSSCSARAPFRGTGSTTTIGQARRQGRPGRLQGLVATRRSASTRPGVTRIHRRSSPPSRPRSSASSPPTSCAAARSRRSASSTQGALLTEQGQQADEVFLLLDGVLSPSRSTVKQSPTSGRGRSSASVRHSRAARGPRRYEHRRRSPSPWREPIRSTRKHWPSWAPGTTVRTRSPSDGRWAVAAFTPALHAPAGGVARGNGRRGGSRRRRHEQRVPIGRARLCG